MPDTSSRQKYLRDVQYGNDERLKARANLHMKYATTTTRWFPWLASQVTWPPDGDVLEVGCGPGWLWAEAADVVPKGLRLTLSDLSPAMVQLAAERVRISTSIQVVDERAADVQNLDFCDGSFDIVVANFMLYHAPDPSVAVREIARVLRPGGCLLAATNGPGNLRELGEIAAEVLGDAAANDPTAPFGAVSGVDILRAHFANVEWHHFEDALHCTDADDVLAYITSHPPAESATPKQIKALRETIQQRLDAGNGTLLVSKQTGAFVASR
jgi:SAM-dependent methyltransferase